MTEYELIHYFQPVFLILLIMFYILRESGRHKESRKWELKDPVKKKGSFPLYYEDRHMANIRGKEKAKLIINKIGGKSSIK